MTGTSSPLDIQKSEFEMVSIMIFIILVVTVYLVAGSYDAQYDYEYVYNKKDFEAQGFISQEDL